MPDLLYSGISNLTVERFRSLKHLRIEGLGRVNLITGKNNTGKSSLLEAIRILASDASPATLSSILRYREEDTGEGEDSGRGAEGEGFGQIGSLFTGFPRVAEAQEPIRIAAISQGRALDLVISLALLIEERGADGSRRFSTAQAELFPGTAVFPALRIEGSGANRVFPLDMVRRYSRGRFYSSESPEEPKMPCVAVSPYGGESTSNLGSLWDKIALSDREEDVVRALQIVAPDISGVSMVGGEGPRRMRTAIVRSRRFSRPVPLRSFGDGLNRLFGIILSLVSAKGGILVIDEFENGMHHSVQLDVWRGIFKLSRALQVQVFATSHSWDAVQAFQQALVAEAEEGTLVRLTRRDDVVIPTLFSPQELAIASRDHIEVR